MTALRSMLFRIVDRLSRPQKQFVLLLTDVLLAPLALLVSFGLVYSGSSPFRLYPALWLCLPLLAVIAGAVSNLFGIPRIKLNAYESSAMIKTGAFALIMTAVVALISRLAMPMFPLSGVILFGLVLCVVSVSIRVLMLHTLLWVLRRGQDKHRVLIYGAGNTGTQLAAALRSHERIVPIAFVDDNRALHSITVAGLKVLSPDALQSFAQSRGIERVILAMPSAPAPRLARLTRRLRKMGLAVQTLPSFAQLVGEEMFIDTLGPVLARSVSGPPAAGRKPAAGNRGLC